MSEYLAYQNTPAPAKQHWSYQKDSSGKVTLMKKHVGTGSEMAYMASQFLVGCWYQINSDDACPISGTFKAERMTAQQTDVGMYEIQRYWSYGGDSGDSSATVGGYDPNDNVTVSYEPYSTAVEPFIQDNYYCSVAVYEAYVGALALGNEEALCRAHCVYRAMVGGAGACSWTPAPTVLSAIQAGSYWVNCPLYTRVQRYTVMPSDVGKCVGFISDPELGGHVSEDKSFQYLLHSDSVSYENGYYVRRRSWLGAKWWNPLLYNKCVVCSRKVPGGNG